MGWWRSAWGPYPGRGPWSHLPPPLRPGWWCRGWWWLYGAPYPPYMDPEAERKYLEDLRKYLMDVVLKEIDRRLDELKKKE